MIYLKDFYFAGAKAEERFFHEQKRTCYDSYYPFQVLPEKGLDEMSFSDITILYGGNGSGKTTVLNIIASKIEAGRMAPYNKSSFYEDYLALCDLEYANGQMENKAIITSDDVFDYMLDIRQLNERIDTKREERFDEYMDYKYSSFKLESIDQVEELRKSTMAKKKTQSNYIRSTLIDNVREYSNGESAYKYFVKHIEQNGIYILDEPENSLSPEMQMELIRFIQDSVRHFGCQFIISTHSPFILAMENALVYDMDQSPVSVRDWHLLKNVQIYYQFFSERAEEFEQAKAVLEEETRNRKRGRYGNLSPARGVLTERLMELGVEEEDIVAIMAMMRQDGEARKLMQEIAKIPETLFENARKEATGQVMEKAFIIYSKRK